MSDIDEFLEKCWSIAVDGLGRIRQDMPQTFYVQLPGNSAVHVLVAPWRDEEEKMGILTVVRKHLAEHRAARYVLLSEAWESSRPIDEDDEDRPMPSQDPNRREVLMAICVDRSGDIRFRSATMVRTDDGTRITENVKNATDFAGLMTRLFEPSAEPMPLGARKVQLWGEGEEKGTLH